MTIWQLTGSVPEGLGIVDGRLAPCPETPNCVCSDCGSKGRRIDAFALRDAQPARWEQALDVLAAMPRTQVISADDEYAHAECRTRLLGFVDDLELHYRPQVGEIGVRSASRLGYSDMGANRARVEELRAALREARIVK